MVMGNRCNVAKIVVAPWNRPCHNQLHSEMRFLTTIQDRELAALSAQGLVAMLRKRRAV